MKEKELNKNSYREFCIKTQNENNPTKYYLMDENDGFIAFNARINKRVAWTLDHFSDRFPLPNGEVLEVLDYASKWWISTSPLSLLDAMMGSKEPMYHLSVPSRDPNQVKIKIIRKHFNRTFM